MFHLTSAQILGDGMILRMRFEAGVSVAGFTVNRLKDTGFRDYLPGLADGLTVAVNGQAAEVIGVNAEDWNMPAAWIDPPSGSSSAIPSGRYFFLVALEHPNGNEVYVSPPIFSYANDAGEIGVDIAAGQAVVLNWRQNVPSGGRVNVYAGQDLPILDRLRRVASVPAANLTSLRRLRLEKFDADGPAFKPRSVCWTVTCRLSSPIAMGETVQVDAPPGIASDDRGNATDAVRKFAAENLSVVGKNGFLATRDNSTATKSFVFNKEVFVSYSRGNDVTGDGSIASPYKTVLSAMAQTPEHENVNFRLMRGDVWPADVWRFAYYGTDLDCPALFDSYWNPAYGADPVDRPVIMVGDPYYDMPAKDLDKTATTFQGYADPTGKTKGNGDRPYIYFSGLAFKADATYANTGTTWPATTAEDFVVLSDCEFQNVCLMPTYGSMQKIAPIGCLVHRCHVHSVHGSPANACPESSGKDWLTFEDRFINPWAGYASNGNNLVIPGQEFIRFFNVGSRWNITNWKVTVTENGVSETRTVTRHADGNGSLWFVDSPWTQTFTRAGCSISLDPTGQEFVIHDGSGAGPTVYAIHGYDQAKRTAKVTPELPALDRSSRIAFLPLGQWDLGGHIQGFFASHCGDWLFNQSIFEANGWNWPDNATYNNIYCHNIYLSAACRDVVTHGCYIVEAGSVGLQQRGGGVVAYNVFASNTHGLCTSGDASVFKNVFVGQGLYNDTLSTAPSHLPASNHDFNLFLASTGSLENRVPSQDYTGITAFNNDARAWAHSHVGFRHNTLVNAGSFRMGLRLPVPGKLHVRNNLFVNQGGGGLDYKGQPLQTTQCSPAAGWNTNGAFTGPDRFADRLDWDDNAYRVTACRDAFAWPDYTGSSYANWVRATGRDTNSILMMDDVGFFDKRKLEINEVPARKSGEWSAGYDAAACWKNFTISYSPRLLPAASPSRLGYYGMVDYRPPAKPDVPSVTVQAAAEEFAKAVLEITTAFATDIAEATRKFVSTVSTANKN